MSTKAEAQNITLKNPIVEDKYPLELDSIFGILILIISHGSESVLITTVPEVWFVTSPRSDAWEATGWSRICYTPTIGFRRLTQ